MGKIGVILAGGEGTRLAPLTQVANKHLLPVYAKPMIYYPIDTLKAMGCTEIVLVSGGDNIGGFAELLKDGSEQGVSLIYRVQNQAGGIPQALQSARGLVNGLFPVILGDNYFAEAPAMPDRPAIYLREVDDAQRFGVYNPETNRIVEKPRKLPSNQAVTGLYVYDDKVFGMIDHLVPSNRNELEITDINNMYLRLGASALHLDTYWRDMGTFHSLLEVANYVKEL